MTIQHRHTSEGDHGLWWIKTDEGEASGTWRTGSWAVVENTTEIDDDEIDMILDQTDFWPGVPADDEWYKSDWDGESLVNLA